MHSMIMYCTHQAYIIIIVIQRTDFSLVSHYAIVYATCYCSLQYVNHCFCKHGKLKALALAACELGIYTTQAIPVVVFIGRRKGGVMKINL